MSDRPCWGSSSQTTKLSSKVPSWLGPDGPLIRSDDADALWLDLQRGQENDERFTGIPRCRPPIGGFGRCYHLISREVIPLPDVLIRDVPAEDLTLLDEQARRVGLTRTEYLRRRLHEQARRVHGSVTSADLNSLATILLDLADPDVMRDAWS